ncbi:MAG: Hsp20/alpha crystallin family protein [Gammaproteobacteria bacterium]|nr:Hsp20/alpha crystallin family protein [Gammaproteobacteria bacterium]
MSWKNLIPWDWFKHEDKAKVDNTTIPVQKNSDLGNLGHSAIMNPMGQFHQEIDRLFDQAFSQFNMNPLRSRLFDSKLWDNDFIKPNCDVSSKDNEYIISVEAPGLGEEDISIELRDDVLTIEGNKKEQKEEKDEHFYRSERRYGTFQRVLSLPKDAQADGIDAKMKNGVLTIRIPRLELEDSQVKRIAISQ